MKTVANRRKIFSANCTHCLSFIHHGIPGGNRGIAAKEA
jgi:hypothetical protein